MKEDKQIARAKKEGQAARNADRSPGDNPYRSIQYPIFLYDAWLDGYNAVNPGAVFLCIR
jgi:hypothetical protein